MHVQNVVTAIILLKRISARPQVVWNGINIAGMTDDTRYIKKLDKSGKSVFGISDDILNLIGQ